MYIYFTSQPVDSMSLNYSAVCINDVIPHTTTSLPRCANWRKDQLYTLLKGLRHPSSATSVVKNMSHQVTVTQILLSLEFTCTPTVNLPLRFFGVNLARYTGNCLGLKYLYH
ncbi:hypothetical protein V6Z11_D11G302800 [Gossypium hirsutum]